MARIIVKDVLKSKGISIKELAERLGVSPSAVSQFLSNPSPSITKLQKIADAINVDVMDFFAADYTRVNGYIEIDNTLHAVRNKEQLFDLMDKVEGLVHIPVCKDIFELKKNIKDFIIPTISGEKSASTMLRYGINSIITLSFDSITERVYCTECSGDNPPAFFIVPLNEYKYTTPVTFHLQEYPNQNTNYNFQKMVDELVVKLMGNNLSKN